MNNSMSSVKVIKATGEVESFSREKLLRSLIRVGVARREAEEVLEEVSAGLGKVVTTGEIKMRTAGVLKRTNLRAFLRYRLRDAMLSLGPEGYPFEQFFARLLSEYGYKVETNLVVRGRCVSHEIDVVAEGNGKRFLVECKHHSAPGKRTDVKVALYVHSRFLDLRDHFDGAWIATNTKLTADAIRYSECMGMRLTAWRYPRDDGLERMIEEKELYPLTVLTSLTKRDMGVLLSAGVVLVRELAGLEQGVLEKLIRSRDRAISALEEARSLCSINGG